MRDDQVETPMQVKILRLSTADRKELDMLHGIISPDWNFALRRYFGLPPSQAEKLLLAYTFTEADIRQGKSMRRYAMDKMRYAKAFGSTQTLQLPTHVYNGIYAPLRQLLREANTSDNAKTYIAYMEAGGESQQYELDRRVQRRVAFTTGRPKVQYVVKWKGYGNEHNSWYPRAN
jgi:hypothetical protein